MRSYVFALLLLILSCGVKQPVDVDLNSDKGNIFVESGKISGTIFLDNQNVNKTTPDTLFQVPVGMHVVKVIKSGFQSQPDSVIVQVEKDKVARASFAMKALSSAGLIFIETTPNRGEIFLDDQPTGLMTPDTIQAEPGTHKIRVVKNGYEELNWEVQIQQNSFTKLQNSFTIRHRILLETFGNVSCTPCVAASENLHRFETEINSTEYALLEYYANWPSPNDPFYHVSPKDVVQRLMFYNVTTLPTLVLDGTRGVDASDYNAILSNFNELKTGRTENLGISVEKALVNDSLRVFVQVYHFDKNLESPDLRLFVAVIENDIHYNSPPGSNGLKDFNFVFRKFLSANNGDAVSSTSQTKEISYALQWPEWNYANSQVIAFIQETNTRQIIQATIK